MLGANKKLLNASAGLLLNQVTARGSNHAGHVVSKSRSRFPPPPGDLIRGRKHAGHVPSGGMKLSSRVCHAATIPTAITQRFFDRLCSFFQE